MRTIWDVSSGQILTYYLIVTFFLLYSLYKYHKDSFFILIIFIFFIGLFAYAGKSVQNIYRVLTLIYALYLTQRTVKIKTIIANTLILISFFLFSLTFLLSSFFNGDNFTLVFSQYSRYLLIFLVYFLLLQKITDRFFQQNINHLIYILILIQIILSIAKMLILGPMESIVGSLSYHGGAIASVVPVLGFAFLWMYRKGNLHRNDWLFILGLIFIGFVNYKRAIWFVLPFFIGLFMFFVQGLKIKRYVFILIIFLPLLFYLGIRINPTLNKEQKVWGSFDLTYAAIYVRDYSFGNHEIQNDQQVASGRGGATNYLFSKIIEGDLIKTDLFGRGLKLMYVEGAKSEEYFVEESNLNAFGSASGFFQFYMVFGFLGVLITLLFVFTLLRKVKNQRIKLALICIFCWEFFLYTGIILREPALSFLFVYLIVYSNHISINTIKVRKTTNLPENRHTVISYSGYVNK